MSDYLFPRRLTRRDFPVSAGAAAAGLAWTGGSASGKSEPGARLGSGYHTYELDADWGRLPEGMKCGFNRPRGGEPEVYIADRQNGRLQVFDLELNHKRNLAGMVRNPCCFYEHKGFLYIPDLASRVTVLDADDKLAAQLGDGKETDGKTNRPDSQTNPALFAAPHSLTVDSKRNFYVVEWIPTGRPRKFKHVPA